MLYWLNRKIEKNNVVILSKNAILVSTCTKDLFDQVEEQFKKNTSPVAVLGKNNISIIPFSRIERIFSQVKTPGIEVSVKTPKAIKKITLHFADFSVREICFQYLKKLTINSDKNKQEKQAPAQEKIVLNKASTKRVVSASNNDFNQRKSNERELKPKLKSKKVIVPKITEQSDVSETQFISEEIKDSWLTKKSLSIAFALVASVVTGYFVYSSMVTSPALYEALQTKNLVSSDIENYLKQGADIDYRGTDGITPLLSAINHGKENLVVTLVKKGANLVNDYNGETALDMAISSGLNGAVNSMLDKNAPSSNKGDLLIRAIQNKLTLEILNKIISLGSSVNYVNENGSSVLATALLFGSDNSVVKLLLEQGASTSIQINGLSPQDFALSRNNQSLALLFSRY